MSGDPLYFVYRPDALGPAYQATGGDGRWYVTLKEGPGWIGRVYTSEPGRGVSRLIYEVDWSGFRVHIDEISRRMQQFADGELTPPT